MCISLLAGCLLAGELADIGEPAPEQIGAAGQVPVEPFVDLVIGDRDGLVLLGLQVGRPGVEGAHVVRLQVLLAGDVEAALVACCLTIEASAAAVRRDRSRP